jgi:hypothetical protein
MARKLRFFKDQVEKAALLTGSRLGADRDYEFDELEVRALCSWGLLSGSCGCLASVTCHADAPAKGCKGRKGNSMCCECGRDIWP